MSVEAREPAIRGVASFWLVVEAYITDVGRPGAFMLTCQREVAPVGGGRSTNVFDCWVPHPDHSANNEERWTCPLPGTRTLHNALASRRAAGLSGAQCTLPSDAITDGREQAFRKDVVTWLAAALRAPARVLPSAGVACTRPGSSAHALSALSCGKGGGKLGAGAPSDLRGLAPLAEHCARARGIERSPIPLAEAREIVNIASLL